MMLFFVMYSCIDEKAEAEVAYGFGGLMNGAFRGNHLQKVKPNKAADDDARANRP